MKKEEKFDAIIERLGKKGEDLKSEHISLLVIMGYLNDLKQYGLIECEATVTPIGKNVMALCDEFEWIPSDEDIFRFTEEMVDKSRRSEFTSILIRYRDNRFKFIEEIESFKKKLNEN